MGQEQKLKSFSPSMAMRAAPSTNEAFVSASLKAQIHFHRVSKKDEFAIVSQ
jgi:hypothetical protein